MFSAHTQMKGLKTMACKWEHCKLSYAEHARTHKHAKKERKLRNDLSVATLQIVLKEEKEKEKETKTCWVFLDSACGCCKNEHFQVLLFMAKSTIPPQNYPKTTWKLPKNYSLVVTTPKLPQQYPKQMNSFRKGMKRMTCKWEQC